MGTRVSLLLPDGQSEAGSNVARRVFEEWEQTFSRFSEDSELSFVNAHAGQWVPVSRLFLEVLQTALDAAHATNGAFDPTMLYQLIGLGYDRSFSQIPSSIASTGYHGVAGGDWRRIQVDSTACAVMLPPGTGLDFGGIAKGMTVDAALKHLVDMGISSAAVEAGGDLAVHGLPPGRDTWDIAVDLKDGTEVVSIVGGGLATSSQAHRRWSQGDKARHHLLDPRTGVSVEQGIWSVTVAAVTCAQAEVAAKTVFILGGRQGAAFLSTHHLTALMVLSDGTSRRLGRWRGIAECETK